MSQEYIEEIRTLLQRDRRVYVNDLSQRFGVSRVSIRKYLATLESEGAVIRFYGGAAVVDPGPGGSGSSAAAASIYADPLLSSLAERARTLINDGDTIFIGSGRSCCSLAHTLKGFKNLTVVTNNITALPELIQNAQRVYLIGGEVTSTDNATLFSSWESPESLLKNIYVNKAFTSTSGLDMKAGLTVNSIISTYIFKYIPTMAHHWYLIADASKFDKIAIYPVAELGQFQTIITDSLPHRYAEEFARLGVEVIEVNR